MMTHSFLKHTLFLDIETVSEKPDYSTMSPVMQELWNLKSVQLQRGADPMVGAEDMYQQKAGIFAEFAKVICISVGFIQQEDDGNWRMKLKSFAGDDEKVVLTEFCALLQKYYQDPEKHRLCGHNIKEFDIPFLCRRLMIHGLSLPSLLDLSGKKPWQTSHIADTMDMWRFGDFKNYTSLNLLAAVLDIESPKDDIDGSMVGKVYWDEKNLPRIVTYCEKDVYTVAQVALKLWGVPVSLQKG